MHAVDVDARAAAHPDDRGFEPGSARAPRETETASASRSTLARMGIRVFGEHDASTIRQLENCVAAEPGAEGVLCADGHLGYSMPIGGVVAYREHLSPSGVGYDIA